MTCNKMSRFNFSKLWINFTTNLHRFFTSTFKPKHPYTKALLSAVPIPDPKVAKANKRIVLEGDIPSPIDPPPGCRFKGRCKEAMKVCGEINPELREVELFILIFPLIFYINCLLQLITKI